MLILVCTWISFRFELRLRVCVGADKLTMIPRVRNVDNKAFSFTIALCNYFSLSDVSVEGLETFDYFDNLLKRERYTEQADAINFDGEIAVIDHERKRTIVLRKEGMVDAD
ncbi:putative aldose 1-/Glucose-6-phosphate 1-epimerase, galactose mutarotase-like domain superfamily [Helianthus anomalus]